MIIQSITNSSFVRALCILIAVGLGSLSPAHSKNEIGVADDLSQYVLPDGSLPVICFGDDQTGTSSTEHCLDCLANQELSKTGSSETLYFLSVFDGAQRLTKARLIDQETVAKSNPPRAPPFS